MDGVLEPGPPITAIDFNLTIPVNLHSLAVFHDFKVFKNCSNLTGYEILIVHRHRFRRIPLYPTDDPKA
jgi:hypothetical protein